MDRQTLGVLFVSAFLSNILLKEVYGDAIISRPPSNSTGLKGSNVTFYCEVSGQQNFEQALIWNKAPSVSELEVNPFQAADILTLNQLSANPDKYLIQDKYRLTVLGVSVGDEGNYECWMGDEFYDAKLTVAVPPSELTISYSGNISAVEISQTVNLTCTSINAHPPASLRWYKGARDITDEAILVVGEPDENGYGDSYSYLPLVVTADDEGAPFRCVAEFTDLPDVSDSMLRMTFNSLAAQPVISMVAMVTMALLSAFYNFDI